MANVRSKPPVSHLAPPPSWAKESFRRGWELFVILKLKHCPASNAVNNEHKGAVQTSCLLGILIRTILLSQLPSFPEARAYKTNSSWADSLRCRIGMGKRISHEALRLLLRPQAARSPKGRPTHPQRGQIRMQPSRDARCTRDSFSVVALPSTTAVTGPFPPVSNALGRRTR